MGTNSANALISIHALCDFYAGLQGALGASRGIVRGLNLLRSFFENHLKPLQTLRIGLSADFDALPLKPLNDGPMINSNVITNTLRAFARQVSLFNRFADFLTVNKILAGNNLFTVKPSVKSLRLHHDFLGKLYTAFSGAVSADKVLSIKTVNFTGHVYDLQTVPGYYIAQGIVISNCRCVAIPSFSETESNIPDAYSLDLLLHSFE